MTRKPDPLAVIMAAFPDARVLDDQHSCPTCGRETQPSRAGHRSTCRRCTLRELGTTQLALSLAVEFGKSLKVIDERLEKFGPPHINPKAWVTPRSKLK